MIPRRGRLLALLLTALLVSSLVLPPATGAQTLPPDVANHWSAQDVAYVRAAGLMGGYPDGSFRPDHAITRGEVFALLARQKGLNGNPARLPEGWPQDHWSAANAAALIQAGILLPSEEPYGGDLNGTITRADLARLLVRLQGRTKPQGVNRLIPDIQGRADAPWISAAVAQGLMAGFTDGTFGPNQPFTRAQTAVVMRRLREPQNRPTLWREAYTYTLPSGEQVDLQVIRANLKNPKVSARTISNPAGIGKTIAMTDMVQGAGAVAAINGGYFSAYNEKPIQDLYDAFISKGQYLHLTGSKRPAVGIWPDGRARIDTFSAKMEGSTDGKTSWPNNWYSYAINHIGTGFGPNWVTIMTPDRGRDMAFDEGLSITVRNGKVVDKRNGPVPIPQDGFVVNLGGVEAKNFRDRFEIGKAAAFSVTPADGWQGVAELVQAGPLLTRNGRVDVDFQRDSFVEAKITEWAGNRSAVGLTADGTLLLLVANPVRVVDLAEIMLDLGAVDSLCMDSGASSGLYYKGDLLWGPGRLLTNALGIFVEP